MLETAERMKEVALDNYFDRIDHKEFNIITTQIRHAAEKGDFAVTDVTITDPQIIHYLGLMGYKLFKHNGLYQIVICASPEVTELAKVVPIYPPQRA